MGGQVPNNNINIDLNEDLTKQLTVYKNLGQEVILTNTDKLKIILTDSQKINKKKSDWIGPVGIFVTILLTLLTAKFDADTFGVNHTVWQAIFYLACAGSCIWSLIIFYYLIRYNKKGTIDEIINKLKNDLPVTK